MLPEIEIIPLQTLASGDLFYLQVYKFKGISSPFTKKENPRDFKFKKVYIQANLHGAEIAGNAVIYQLIEFLSSLDESQVNGEIWLVPVCNPVGVNQRTHFFSTGRFNPHDGKDWNRIFWDYEKEVSVNELELFAQKNIDLAGEELRTKYLEIIQTSLAEKINQATNSRGLPYSKYYAYVLQSLSIDANYVIDLHSASINAIDYLYCFQDRQSSTEYFLFDYGILMNKYDGDAFDEAFLKPWLALEYQLKKLGRNLIFDVESWTLELGSGMTMNPSSVTKGVEGIKNYLHYKKILNLPNLPQKKSPQLIPKNTIQTYYATQGGMIQNCVEKGTRVKKGEKLYEILSFNKSSKIPTIIEISSQDSGLVFDVSSNQTVNQGEYVLGIFLDNG